MRREGKKKEEASIREKLRKIRYIRILDDCHISINESTIPLKKGDIVRIYNDQIEDLVFDKRGGILFQLGYQGDGGKTKSKLFEDPCPGFELKKYPDSEPLNIIKYLKMQPKVKLIKPIKISLWIDKEWVYLTQELLYRMLHDESDLELNNGKTESVSQYNGRWIADAFKNGTKVIMIENAKKMLPFFGENSNTIGKQKRNTLPVPQNPGDIKTGLYKAKEGTGYLPLVNILKKGEEIDFSKLEYALLTIDQDFMKVLANSREITSLREKEKIYKLEQQGFFNGTNFKYYIIKDDIEINPDDLHYMSRISYDFEKSSKDVNVGNGYDKNRVWGEIKAVEIVNGRVTKIKVEFDNPAIYLVMDKEIRKIARRMNEREILRAKMHEREEEQREKDAKRSTEYFRYKMLADLADSYILDGKILKDSTSAKESGEEKKTFQDKAHEYVMEHQKQYDKIWKILEFELTEEQFYMMHLIRENFKDNRKIDAEYKNQIEQKKQSFINVLKNFSQKKQER